jgi:alkylation response protein AidB-like acyl-CoA dehydrogenase
MRKKQMNTGSARASAPSVDELVTRSLDISHFVREFAEQAELTRQVSPEAVSRIRRAGLFRILQPAIYGGYEYGFDALLRVVAPIGAGCGSTGWVLSLGVVHQWLIAAFPKQAQDEYFADLDALAFGSYPPVGKVIPVDGGFRLSGVWGFTSGCDLPVGWCLAALFHQRVMVARPQDLAFSYCRSLTSDSTITGLQWA